MKKKEKQISLLEVFFKDKSYTELLDPNNHDDSTFVKNLIEQIEKMMEVYSSKITYTQVRNILQIVKKEDFENNITAFYKVIPRLAYMEARPQKKAEGKFVITFIRELAGGVNTKEEYKSFIEILDTLVAYHKLYG